MLQHEILIKAYVSRDAEGPALEVRCACGTFILDRADPAEASLVEITGLIAAHYMHVQRPEKSNGQGRLLRGKK